MSGGGRSPRRGATLRALAVAGMLGALVVAAGQVPTPLTTPADLLGSGAPGPAPERPGVVPVRAPVSSAELVCAGPEEQTRPGAGLPQQAQTVTVLGGSAPQAVLPQPARSGEPGRLVLDPTGPSQEVVVDARGELGSLLLTGPEGALVRADGGLAAGLAAGQVQLSLRDQQRGLGATPCIPPAQESWLVAGGAQPGRAERLVLVNPGADPVTATVRVLGAAGPARAVTAQGVVVPAGSRVVSLLDAVAPGVASPVVQVTSAGGPVAAFLGDRWLEGSTDRGLELTAPVAPPATGQLIPGVLSPPGQDARVSLRVGVPGTEQAVVQVRALGPDGPVRVRQDVTLVPRGQSQDIVLGDLPAGAYTVQVTADVPVVAAVQVGTAPAARTDPATRVRAGGGTGPGGASDLAWAPATGPVTGLAGLPLPSTAPGDAPALTATLELASVEQTTVQVSVLTPDGSARVRAVEVEPESITRVDVGGGRAVWVLPGEQEVYAAVSLRARSAAGDLITIVPLRGLPLTRGVTSVSPRLP